MNKYISILRGINVGGKKRIKMDSLKALYESLDFQNVVTYIQSGNVIFETLVGNTDGLKMTIEKAIEEKYKFRVPVQIRTNHEIENVIKNCPFSAVNLVEDGTKVLVTFLSSKPHKETALDIQKHVVAPEKLVIRGTEV